MGSISSSRKPVVLYVEDSVAQREATAELLEDDFDILQAGCAEEGLAIAERYGQRLDVALVDRMMPQPGMQGDELAFLLSERGHRVVVLSAKKGTDHRKELLGPAIVYLEKPIDPDELRAQLSVIARLRFADQVADGMNALAAAAQYSTGSFGNGLSAVNHIDLSAIPPEQKPYVAALCGAARDLQKALDQLATFSRLRLRQVDVQRERVRVADMIGRCRYELERDLAGRTLRLEVECGEAVVRCDPNLLRTTLETMLAHAVAAAEAGTVIRVTVPSELEIVVAYDGTGFTEAELDRLFETAPGNAYRHHGQDFGLRWTNAAMAAAALDGALIVESAGPVAGAVLRLRLEV